MNRWFYFKIKGLFEIVVTVAVQSACHLEMHQINFFIFLKLFLTSAHQNDLKTYKKKFILIKKNF
jgi:hypothetical protein